MLQQLAEKLYRPWALRYIKQPHMYSYMGMKVHVPVGIFHPGIFFSTKMLARYVAGVDLKGKRALELGCGSGLLSVLMASKGALVTAVDINPLAVETTSKNAERNEVACRCLCSDLFESLPDEVFDLIVINPPYFKKAPSNLTERAWFAGERFEYFHALFDQLEAHIDPKGQVIMSASDRVDVNAINTLAKARGFELLLLQKRWKLIEWHKLYEIKILS